jgi:uncharacterized protein (DUF58 family)
MGFVFTFLLAAVAQASTFCSYKNLSGLTVSIAKTTACFAGSTSSLNISIKELDRRERWVINANHKQFSTIFDLNSDETKIISIPIRLDKRGWYTPKTITLSTQFPFGFFRAWSPLLFNQPILVYPKAVDTGLVIPNLNNEDGQGATSSQQKGADDFAGLKPYQQGQSYRHINWKALAAQKGLYSNEFNADQSADIWLSWASCTHLDNEQALSQLCFWVLACESSGEAYGLRLPHIELLPQRGPSHQHACLKELALYGQ